MSTERRNKSVVWIVLGVIVVAALVVFGRPLFAPTDPEDAAMKVRRPVPPPRRAPGQISNESAVDPNAPAGDASGQPDQP